MERAPPNSSSPSRFQSPYCCPDVDGPWLQNEGAPFGLFGLLGLHQSALPERDVHSSPPSGGHLTALPERNVHSSPPSGGHLTALPERYVHSSPPSGEQTALNSAIHADHADGHQTKRDRDVH